VDEASDLLELTTEIVSSHVSNNSVAVNDLPNLIRQVHEALAGLGEAKEDPKAEKTGVVSVRASVKPDYLVCMECGKKQKTLKRHLQNAHGMTPAEYRAGFKLPKDYPMVAPAYSKRRSEMAHSIGLGRKRNGEQAGGAAPASEQPKRRSRKPKDEAARG
jgi:predicted transcriptional regulator